MKFIVSLVVIMMLCCSTEAQTITVGSISYDNAGYAYTYAANGYWAYGSQYYTRTYYPGYSYYSCGRLVSAPGYYSFTLVPTPVAVAYDDEVTIVAKAVAARSAAVDAEYKLRTKAETVSKLIRDNNLHVGLPIYGSSYVPGNYGGFGSFLYDGKFGINHSTVYGVAPSLDATAFFNPDLNQSNLAYAQTVLALVQAGEKATSDLSVNNNNLANRAAELQRIKTMGNVFSQLLNSPTVKTDSTYTFQVGPNGRIVAAPGANTEVLPTPKNQAVPVNGSIAERLSAVVVNNGCTQCHSSAKKEGNFDITTFFQLDGPSRFKVYDRLTIPDGQQGHMPKGMPSLSAADMKVFAEALTAPVVAKDAVKPEPMPKLK